MVIAVYPGSFDPITNGHLDLIERGAKLCDRLIVAVLGNETKQPLFTVAERQRMLTKISSDYPNVQVASFENQLLVNYAKSINARYILRGIRSNKDYEYEKGIRQVNEDIDGGIITIFLMPSAEVANISSSLVKGLVGPGGWESVVKRYVPECVFEELLKKAPKE